MLCLPALASCGHKPSNSVTPTTPDGSTPPSSVTPPTSGSTGDNTACDGKDGSTVINFWHALNNVNQTAVFELTNRFNAAHKGDICVSMTSQTNYDNIFENIISAIKSNGNAGFPDLATTYPDHVATYAQSDAVVDMTPYASDSTIGYPATGDDSYNDILPNYRRESTNYRFTGADLASPEGKMYSLPLNKSTEIMYYNKTFFDYWSGKTAKMADGKTITDIHTWPGDKLEDTLRTTTTDPGKTEEQLKALNLGEDGPYITYNGKTGYPSDLGFKNPADIDPSNPATWWTWDDVRTIGEIIQIITKSKIDPTNIDYKKYNEVILANDSNTNPSQIKERGNWSFSYDSPTNLFVTLANQVNSYVRLEDDNKGGVAPNFLFNSRDARGLYKTYADLFDDGIATVPGAIGDGTLSYATTPFISSYLFLSAGSVAGAALNSSGSFETGTAPIPQYSTENAKVIQQGTNLTMMGLKSSTIGGDAQRKEKAEKTWEYVKYLTSHEANLYFATHTTYMPTRTSVINSDEYKAYLNAGTAERNALKTAIAVSNNDGVLFTDPPFVGSGSVRTDSELVILDALLSSTITMEQAIQDYYNKCTDTYGAK